MIKTSIDRFNTIKSNWDQFKSDPNNKKIRIRDAAKKLNISEAELLSTQIDNVSIRYLFIDNFKEFFNSILSLDKIMLLIRNDYVVHEKIIETNNLLFEENRLYSQEKQKNLILKFNKNTFNHSFFECKMHAGKKLYSFQFFDFMGNSILKIYLKGKAEKKFDEIALQYTSQYRYQLQLEKEFKKSHKEESIEPIYYDNNYIKKNLDKIMIREILETASKKQIPIQIHGIGLHTIQYHQNIIKNVIDYGPWINVIDKNFNIHILENQISKNSIYRHNDECYSIEFFDTNSNHLMGISMIDNYKKEFTEMLNNFNIELI